MSSRYRTTLLSCLLILVFIGTIIPAFRWARSTTIGSSDFGGYWTASYLFSMGENPCDADNVLEVERAHVQPDREWPMMAWNPPTLWVFLLPLARTPFQTARSVWLLINLGLLVGSCFMLHHIYCPEGSARTLVIYCLVALLFAPVLVAIIHGQIVLLVLFGIVGALFLIEHRRWLAAGAILILATPKPHLVMLSLPYLMLYSAQRRKWRAWAGFFTAGLICVAVLFAFRPTWICDYTAYFRSPPTDWQTPTLGGVLRSRGVGRWVQFTGLGLLALLPLFLRNAESFPPEEVTALLTLVTVPCTFFGWSYDQSLLLLPAAQILRWLHTPGSPPLGRFLVGLLGTGIIAGSMVHRVTATNEVEFFWVPLAVAALYALAWAMRATKPVSS